MKIDPGVSYDPTLDWASSLKREEGSDAAFAPLWQDLVELATNTYGWRAAGSYKGEVASFEIHSGPVDQLYIWARRERSGFPQGSEILPPEVLVLQFRYRDNNAQLPEGDKQRKFNGYIAVVSPRETEQRKKIYIYVGVKDWPSSKDLDERMDAVTNACLAGIQIFMELTGIQLPGVKSS
jgi:hypothetical protein